MSIHSRKEAVLSRVLELKLAWLSRKALLLPLRHALNWGNVYGRLFEEGMGWLCGVVVAGVECTCFRFLAPSGRTLVLRESGALQFRGWGDFPWVLLWLVTKTIG